MEHTCKDFRKEHRIACVHIFFTKRLFASTKSLRGNKVRSESHLPERTEHHNPHPILPLGLGQDAFPQEEADRYRAVPFDKCARHLNADQ